MKEFIISNLKTALDKIPFAEILIGHPVESFLFLILVMITVFRKRLSSNHAYRDRMESSGLSHQRGRFFQRRRYISGSSNSESGKLTSVINSVRKNLDPVAVYDSVSSTINNSSQELLSAVISSVPQSGVVSQPTVKNRSPFLSLTAELQFHILYHLETIEILKFSHTSHSFYDDIVKNEFIWEQLWILTYGHIWRLESIKEIRMYRKIFWDPLTGSPPPKCGWARFYIAFEICWLDWVSSLFGSFRQFEHHLFLGPGWHVFSGEGLHFDQ